MASPELIESYERWHLIALLGVLAGVATGAALGATLGVEYGVAAFLLATSTVAVVLATRKGLDLVRTRV